MPHYYFHLRTPDELEWDNEGVSFGSLDDAYLDVCHAISRIASDLIQSGGQRARILRYAFEIADVGGGLLMDVPFSEVLDEDPERFRHAPARHGSAEAEIARTRRLIAALNEQRAALAATLCVTQELLDRLRGRDGRARPTPRA
ncbi:DUF6894 family protein [Methylobacterium durans]|uniref:DUF6894 domain-containing protein n=1 Tax=Methylobacterium durans TaxID=2202825 RepID=A0A2U8W6C5_9HYPH|nr:hypothetical protein [Methylobacterium durans]AWN41674.1 hypothetical protein DK389_15620 [Methylobacterium durans]